MRDVVVDIDVVNDAMALACRAPSLHNSQPWRWVGNGHGVQLFLDADRAPRYTDPTGRELVISCGAVLDHFRVAMAAMGWIADVERLPNPNNLDHLASVGFAPMDFVAEGHRRRAQAVLRRRTDRLPMTEPPGWDAFLQHVFREKNSEAVSVHVVADESRPRLAQASQLAQASRLYESRYHAELLGWTSDVAVAEGIPAGALLSAAESDRVDIRRDFPTVDHAERRGEIARDFAKILVIATDDVSRGSILRCGEMLSSVLLDATMAGLATCTLSHLTEVPESREIVATLTGDAAIPQVLIRVGSAPSSRDTGPPTPRLRTEDVFEIRD
ncbi:NAD(P)H nitroreductase [Mycobacterium sp. ITM-2017-0098]|nr:NAD(P)H nitroreductase [Mycobacterium sp. ITM-2017-0098]